MAFLDIAKKTGRVLAVTAAVLAAASLAIAPRTAYAERGDHEDGGRHGGGGDHERGAWHRGGGHEGACNGVFHHRQAGFIL